MSTRIQPTQGALSADGEAVQALYERLLDAWNERDAAAYADQFTPDASVIGFDGSMMNGQEEVRSQLSVIFAHHQTARYVAIVREVRTLSTDVVLLRAVVGMVPPGQTTLNPNVNAVQTLVAQKREGAWRIALFQNTPAQFHGRPELAQQLTEELQALTSPPPPRGEGH